MTTREELVEAMARAICVAQGLDWKDQFGIYSSNGDPLAHEAYMHDADAALSAFRQWMEDEGLAIVPKKATGAMFSAALQRDDHGDLYHGIYTAMIAAAPDALRAQGESS